MEGKMPFLYLGSMCTPQIEFFCSSLEFFFIYRNTM